MCRHNVLYQRSQQAFPFSQRGRWADTPGPGTYHICDFIEEAELNPVRKTYGFKGMGRKPLTLGVCKTETFLPGAYDYTDVIQEVQMHKPSYFFKNCPRPDIVTLGIRDKVGFRQGPPPCQYNPQTRPAKSITSCFKSTVPRLHYVHSVSPALTTEIQLFCRTRAGHL
uniref:Uncharacterized protein n=1 Tax=Mola mola TaxID=94237 RepID=A0A3Q4AZT4_MOLML